MDINESEDKIAEPGGSFDAENVCGASDLYRYPFFEYLQFITGFSILNSLQISQPLLNNLKGQILARFLKI